MTYQARPILTLDQDQFIAACRDLMSGVLQRWRPEAIVGIRTGGFLVAQTMARHASNIAVIPVTCRRPSTRYKQALGVAKAAVARLPTPVLDKLRVLEHKVLTRAPKENATPPQFDPREVIALSNWFGVAGKSPALLVVDDAVDTGVTLSHVMSMVCRHAPEGADVRSAVITVTTDRPVMMPDYTLYRRQLCRFPWSLDLQGRRK